MNNIRNFVITAHVDHGKSTLADRLLEITGTVEKRVMKPQYLDQLDLERERGITIKMAPVRMVYRNSLEIADSEHILNLIDTPGHSDFGYEVSRALAAVEGAVLLVDATQGIQAQTLANFENARKTGLAVIGAVNKIDAAAPEQVEETVKNLAELLGAGESDILKVSGRTGEGVEALLAAVIKRTPPPRNKISNTSRALVFDSFYDEHKGVVAHIRVFNGEFRLNQTARLIAGKADFKIKEIGYFAPELKPAEKLSAGEIGFIATGIKDPDVLKIGDTIAIGEAELLSGYQEPQPVVFVSLYPENAGEYDEFKRGLSKLRLSDAALSFEPDYSEVLGRGFKGGFLGRLHFEITTERLFREFNISTVNSFPSVAYRVRDHKGWKTITNPKDFPQEYFEAEEPMTEVEILTKPSHLGAILRLKDIFRLSDIRTETLGSNILIKAKLPLSDLIRDLDDKLKSVSEGYASLNYKITGYEKAKVAKLEILVASGVVPGLTRILPAQDIEKEGRATVEKLKDLLPRQQFVQALQAASGGRIISRETIPAMRKLLGNFGKTGGDRTRKMKLWKKQQKGKQKLKEIGEKSSVKIPAHIFKELLKK